MSEVALKINYFLSEFHKLGRLHYEKVSSYDNDKWVLYIYLQDAHSDGFRVDISLDSGWVSFSSILTDNIQGKYLPVFYELLLRINSYFSGLKLVITPQNGKHIVLQSEIKFEDLDKESFNNMLSRFYLFVLNYYPRLMSIAAELDLAFRNNENVKVNELMKKFTKNSRIMPSQHNNDHKFGMPKQQEAEEL